MKHHKLNRAAFDPDNISPEGSLGLLALGDIGFEAWCKAKGHIRNNENLIDGAKK